MTVNLTQPLFSTASKQRPVAEPRIMTTRPGAIRGFIFAKELTELNAVQTREYVERAG